MSRPVDATGFIPIAREGDQIAGYWVTAEALIPDCVPRTAQLEQHLALLEKLFPGTWGDSVKTPPK